MPLSEEYLLRGWFTCPQYLEFLYNDLMVSSEWLAKELETQSMRQELSSYFHNEPVTLQNLWGTSLYLDRCAFCNGIAC